MTDTLATLLMCLKYDAATFFCITTADRFLYSLQGTTSDPDQISPQN